MLASDELKLQQKSCKTTCQCFPQSKSAATLVLDLFLNDFVKETPEFRVYTQEFILEMAAAEASAG